MCRPHRHFWGMVPGADREPRTPCITLAESYGVDLPA